MLSAVAGLRRAADVGPYFTVELDPAGPQWLPLLLLVDEPDAVRERIGVVRAALAGRCDVAPDAIDARASASIHVLGLAARLIAPALAVAALDGLVPQVRIDDVRWQRVDGGPVPIGLAAVPRALAVDDPRAAARTLAERVVAPIVAPVIDAFADVAGVSRIVLWGNVASALAGAAGMLVGSPIPTRHDPVAIVTALLALPGPLHEAGAFGTDGRFFVRTSCCLFYRIPNGGKCGDCVLL